MSEAWEYGEDDEIEDEIPDEDDEIRMQILEAEANEVWQEEPGDEDDEARPVNPLFGMLSAMGGLPFTGLNPDQTKDEKPENEDPEH